MTRQSTTEFNADIRIGDIKVCAEGWILMSGKKLLYIDYTKLNFYIKK